MLTYPIGLLAPKVNGGGIPINGLEAEYLFNGNANDSSGNGLDLTVQGCTLTNGKDGSPNSAYMYDLNSVDNTDALYRLSTELSLSQYCTTCGWFRISEAPSSFSRTFRLYTAVAPNGGFDLAYFSGFGGWYTAFLNNGVSKIYNYPSISINVGVWYFFMVELNGVDQELYINNVLQTRSLYYDASPTQWSNKNLAIYIGNSNTLTQSSGKDLDNVRIYNRLLTANEKLILYSEL